MRKKSYKVLIRLTVEEAKLARNAILEFRNRVIQAGGPVEDLDDLLRKLTK